MPRGTNLPRVGNYNQSIVLDAVRRSAAGLSQVQIIELTGLSKQTVSNIARRLLDAGLLRSHGVTIAGRGKPRTTLRVDATSLYAVGVHLDPSLVTVVILDLGGKAVASDEAVGVLDKDPVASIGRVAAMVEALIVTAGIDRSTLAGVGIASPGPLDYTAGALVDPPWLEGWNGLKIAEAASSQLDLPVLVDKDTIAITTGECWSRDHHDGRSLVFIYLGTGIGSAVAHDGTVMRGATHNAGEIGHLLVDVEGTLCPCGRRGCLGRASDPSSLVQDARDLGVLDFEVGALSYESVGEHLNELCDLADRGNAQAQALLNRAANAIAEATRILVGIHDANLVVFGGPFWARLQTYYLGVVTDHLAASPEPRTAPTRVEGTVMGNAVGAVGAASLVLDNTFSTKLSAYVNA